MRSPVGAERRRRSVDDEPAAYAADVSEPLSALPSVRARAIAFASIIVFGLLGAAIGSWFARLTDQSTWVEGAYMLLGTVVVGLGTAAVAVIGLRTVAEWTTNAHDDGLPD